MTPRFIMRTAIVGLAFIAVGSVMAATGSSATRNVTKTTAASSTLSTDIAQARLATAKYVSNLALAKKDGYMIITKMIPNMGFHYLNPNVKGFNVKKPPILVYEKKGTTYNLAALEWVFTSKPAKAPWPGAKYGSFGAGCHYADGSFVPAATQDACPKTDPQSGAAFTFWHPLLITLHVWLWYPNPSGIYASTNSLVSPFNGG